jgi:hypothetical protein
MITADRHPAAAALSTTRASVTATLYPEPPTLGNGKAHNRWRRTSLQCDLVNAGNWISLAGVIIAGVSAALAVRSARRAGKAESAAAAHERQALEAAQDAAGHAKRSADAEERVATVTEAQQSREATEAEEAEGDPWQLDPIPGDPDCYLINRTKYPKYGVAVVGLMIHNGPAEFDVIGPGKREELSIMRIAHPDNSVEITWYRRRDLSDSPQTKRETIPSRI